MGAHPGPPSPVWIGDTLALAGLSLFTLILAALVGALVVSVVIGHATVVRSDRPWTFDGRPSLDGLGVTVSGSYWTEEYAASLEEVTARFSPIFEYSSVGQSIKCDGCHVPIRIKYPIGGPLACMHAFQETHPEEADCVTCHIPPHPVDGECRCCECHGCWETGWTVEMRRYMPSEECFACHAPR